MIKIKNQEQLEGIRKAGQIAADCLEYLNSFIAPGITTDYLNNKAADFIYSRGGVCAPLNYKGYPKETCISLNETICHGIPDDTKLKNGDILNVDVTVIKDGYYGDTSKMYTVGKISKEAENLIETAKKCLDIGIDQVRPNNYFGNIGFMIASHALNTGYSVVYQFCGHGTGLEFHEEPNVSHIAKKDSGPLMKPGMVFTIEPMINIGVPEGIINENDGWTVATLDKKLSAQFEHTVAVTETGCEILTTPTNKS